MGERAARLCYCPRWPEGGKVGLVIAELMPGSDFMMPTVPEIASGERARIALSAKREQRANSSRGIEGVDTTMRDGAVRNLE